MGAFYDAAARALREPSSERQAQAWQRQNYFFEHFEELEDKRRNGDGTDTITSQRRERGNGYLHVRDWSELDGYAFKCNTTRQLAAVLLSLFAFKKLRCVQGSHEGLAEMMGVFGKLCSAGSIRNAIAELVPLGLKVEPYFDHHPEGFRCRKDRHDDGDDNRRLREWVEASPLYSPAGQLAEIIDRVRARQKKPRCPRRVFSRLPTLRNLSGSGTSDSQKYQQTNRAPAPCGKPPKPVAGPSGKRRKTQKRSSVRPSAARLTARPKAAPEKAAMRGKAARHSAAAPNPHAEGPPRSSVARSAVGACPDTPRPAEVPRAAQDPPPDLVRELVALALGNGGDAVTRAARLAELAALADSDDAAPPSPAPPPPPPIAPPVEQLTPLEERRRNVIVLPLIRAQRDAVLASSAQPAPVPESRGEAWKNEKRERQAEARRRSRQRVERPSVAPSPLAHAFAGALATLSVRQAGGSNRDEQAATAALDREQKRAALDKIDAAVDELAALVARLPAARAELVDRFASNLVSLYKRGQLELDDVLRQLGLQRRALMAEPGGDAAPTLARLDTHDRAVAVVEASNHVDPFAEDKEQPDPFEGDSLER